MKEFTADTGSFKHECIYEIAANGSIKMDNKVTPMGFENAPLLPRMGLKLGLAEGLENTSWYGRGPHENYPDRNESAHLGLYQSTATDMFVPYVAPQESGGRSDTRWLTLGFADGKKAALKVESNEPFQFSALHYDAVDMDQAARPSFVTSRKETILCIDSKMLGLGNQSCGPPPLAKYMLPVKGYEFSFILSIL